MFMGSFIFFHLLPVSQLTSGRIPQLYVLSLQYVLYVSFSTSFAVLRKSNTLNVPENDYFLYKDIHERDE